jgi:Holliday junction DNA helicase RuvB
MEDGKLDLVIGSGPGARTVELRLPPFTLVGATTRAGLLSQPFTARFGITHRLDYYDPDALATIVTRSSEILGCPVDAEAAREIAKRSRGTPRIANRLLRRVRDYAEVAGETRISARSAETALDKLEVDQHGLDEVDRRILATMIERFGGGPVGLSALAHSLGEDKGTLEDLYEPFLLQSGFLQRTPKGRVASALAYRHLGLKPATGPGSLFG